MEKYKQILDVILASETDFKKFYEKGNNSAGTRIRKTMQELKSLCQDIRVDITDKKKKVQE